MVKIKNAPIGCFPEGRTFFIEKSALSFVIFYLLLIKVKLNKLTIG